jgi:hypothetical protein
LAAWAKLVRAKRLKRQRAFGIKDLFINIFGNIKWPAFDSDYQTNHQKHNFAIASFFRNG